MFSFAGTSTPAFGAASNPAFGGAAPASTPSLFGAASSGAAASFGQSMPAFGTSASPFGGGVATPAFGGASAGSLFGAASTPSLFGASAAGYPGAAAAGGDFGTTSTPSVFGAASSAAGFGFQSGAALGAPSLFGAVQLGGAPGATHTLPALATKDGRPIMHSSKWDDLSPQSQQYLIELEKVVVQCREECRQLDADPRLASPSGAKEQRQAMEAQAHTRSQSISSLGSAVKADLEAAAALREAVLHLVRSGETALHTFKRAHAWREAAKSSAPLTSQDISGTPVLPSQFLREAISGFRHRLGQHQAVVAELEQVLAVASSTATQRSGSAQPDGLAALQSALTNAHDFLIHAAARLQALDDRVAAAREAYLAQRRAMGDSSDPFAADERRQAQRAEQQPRSPAAQAAALHAAQHAHGQLFPGASPTMVMAGVVAGPAAATPSGLFGTVQPSGVGGFGTPMFDGQQLSVPSSRKPGSRRKHAVIM